MKNSKLKKTTEKTEKDGDIFSRLKNSLTKMIFTVVYTSLKERRISKLQQIAIMLGSSIQLMHFPFQQQVSINPNFPNFYILPQNPKKTLKTHNNTNPIPK
jgi:hypothetical protein